MKLITQVFYAHAVVMFQLIKISEVSIVWGQYNNRLMFQRIDNFTNSMSIQIVGTGLQMLEYFRFMQRNSQFF